MASVVHKRKEKDYFIAVSEIITEGLTNSNISYPTVTDAKLSSDGSHLTVYVSFINKPNNSLENLENAKGYIRKQISKTTSQRIVPSLTFKLDTSSDKGIHIDNILNSLGIKYEGLFIASTDTVVGLGAPVDPMNANTINELKRRADDKKLIIMVSSLEHAREFEGWNDEAEKMAEKHWPGSTTLVISDKIALRIPDCEKLRDYIESIGGKVYMTSANRSGQAELSFEEAIVEFKEVKKHFNFCAPSGTPSTIIKVQNKEVLR